MGYTALYRKFRPLTFSEIVGQEHITKTLKNQIILNRVGHAYLFNGGRGTGKTTAAKILARAINCLNPKDGEPCNECEICKEAIAGSLTDIVEMDAASNNSVEDIRGIKEEVNFLPTKAKYRVYIIDEVHMLSTGAFNALLKTLEEPPEHVKFILATTEPQRLPATILSRCQRFDFKRIPNEDIVKRLEIVCDSSSINATKGALNLIAELSEGAMRDALSILERCIQDGDNEVEEDKLRDLLGIPQITMVYKIVKSVIEYDVGEALNSINVVLSQGKDVNNLLWEMIKYIKDILLVKINSMPNLYNEKELKNMKELADMTTKEYIIKLIYELSELENNMKWSTQKLIMFQAGIIKLCNKKEESSEGSVTGENKQLEVRVKKLEEVLKNIGSSKLNIEVPKEKKETKKIEPKENKAKTIKEENSSGKIKEIWPKVIDELRSKGKMTLYSNLIKTSAVEINDMTIGIQFPEKIPAIAKTFLENPENAKTLSEIVAIKLGKEMNIRYIDSGKEEKKTEENVDKIENFANGFDIPFNVID